MIAVMVMAATAFAPGNYRLVGVHLEVEHAKANGKAWDFGSDPDPKVDVRVDGVSVATCKAQDSTTLDCAPGVDVTLGASSHIELDATDVDVVNDDTIGTATTSFSPAWGLGAAIALDHAGQIHAASITFERVPPQPSSSHLGQVVSVIAVGLLAIGCFAVYGLLSRRVKVVRERVVVAGPHQPLEIRCRHCDALIAGGAMTCDKCGAHL